jgi:hypothetical protein
MITLKDFMETVDYKITEGSDYCWHCYGENTHRMERHTGDHTGNTVVCIFDTNEHFLYEMEAWDNANDRVYRWIHPNYIDALKSEYQARELDFKNAYDAVDFIDLETTEDILKKARAIVNHEEYDTRVDVPLRMDDDNLFELMKLAHEQDITLNQLVEDVLRNVISAHETGTDDPIDFPVERNAPPAKMTAKKKSKNRK